MALNIALAKAISKSVAMVYEGVGITSVSFIEPNIFRFTLSNGSTKDVIATNLNAFTTEEKAKLLSLNNTILTKFTVDGSNNLLYNGTPLVSSSTTNGNIKVNGVETKVYDDTSIQTSLSNKVNSSQVLTNVPSGAIFTDTVTSINGDIGNITLDTNTMNIDSNKNISAKIWKGTKIEYDNIAIKDNTMTYVVTDELDEVNKITSSTINGNIKINGTETKVYDDININNNINVLKDSGTIRPMASYVGQIFFDTNLNKPIWCKNVGTQIWVDAMGTVV